MIPWLASAFAAPPAPAPAPAPVERKRETYTLDNGLVVTLLPDPSVPTVAVDVWYHVGSRCETPGRTGFAHLFEHLMFQGSPNQPDEYFAPLEKIGANLNGSTNQDRTNYYEVVPREYLPLALFLEADRMGGLLQTLTQDKLDNQREVVRNERRQRVENVPYGDARILLNAALYPAGHGYHHSTIGSHEDLEAATLDDVSAFFRTWYVPNDASLVIAGDFDPAVAKDLVGKYFGPVARGEPVSVPSPPDPTLHANVEVREYRDVPQRKVWLAWNAPKGGTQADAELDLLAAVLGDGRDGRLVRELVERRRVAQEVAVFEASGDWSSVFQIRATAAEGHTTDEVLAAVDEVLAQVLGEEAPTAGELAAVRNSYRLDYLDGLEPILGRAEYAQLCIARFGDSDCLARDLARYDAATPASVLATGQQVLRAPRVALHMVPLADEPAPPPEVPVGKTKKPKKPKKPKKSKDAAPAEPAPAPAPNSTGGTP